MLHRLKEARVLYTTSLRNAGLRRARCASDEMLLTAGLLVIVAMAVVLDWIGLPPGPLYLEGTLDFNEEVV